MKVFISIKKVLPFASMFLTAVTVSSPAVAELPACSSVAPCYTVTHRQSSVGLAVNTGNVSAVYLNRQRLTRGAGADYHLVTGANHEEMVMVDIPANTTDNPELFQIIKGK